MGRVIAVANQKGGVGKTTTTVNLAACLAEKGKEVLVIDIDPQGNTTSGLGTDKNSLENSTYDILLGECSFKDAVLSTSIPGLSLVPSNMDLSGAEIELVSFDNNSKILRNAMRSVRKAYDYILIDCPPSLSLLTVNAMCAADTVLVPIQCEYYALEGLTQLMHTIDLFRKRLNHSLEIEGIVFTMYDSRTNLSAQVVENVRANLDANIYETIIPRNIRLAEAPSYSMPITVYDPRSTGANAYRLLAEEVIEREDPDKWQ